MYTSRKDLEAELDRNRLAYQELRTSLGCLLIWAIGGALVLGYLSSIGWF